MAGMAAKVSRSGEKPEPTVTVRMKENRVCLMAPALPLCGHAGVCCVRVP